MALTEDGQVPAFVPIVPTQPPADTEQARAASVAQAAKRTTPVAGIEIRLAGAVVRVAAATDAALLTEVLRAIRASAA